MKSITLIVVSLLFSLNSCAELKTDVTVCDLLENGDSYSGRVVKVKGNYYVGFEHSFLGCSSCICSGCLDAGIALDWSKIKEKDWELFQRDYQYNDLIANVILVGEFRKEESVSTLHRYEYLLEVHSIEKAEVIFNEVTNTDSLERRSIAETKALEFCPGQSKKQ